MLLTRFQWIANRAPAPLNGVMPSFAKAETRNVRNVPGQGNPLHVAMMFPATVHPGGGAEATIPAAATGAVAGVGAATAESKMRSHWKPM